MAFPIFIANSGVSLMTCWRRQIQRKQRSDKWHAKLIMLKQTAYAWRQMIFFVSLLPLEEQRGFIIWADSHLHEQPADFRVRFALALRGLELAHEGRSTSKKHLEPRIARMTRIKKMLRWSDDSPGR